MKHNANKDKELVSIIMSAYNAEETIERAIRSILGQTYKNIELIIINDGSTDGTLDIAKKFLSRKVRVIDNSINSGTYFCRNYGIRISQGKYITFHDSDDWSDDSHIESLYLAYLSLKDMNIWSGTKYFDSKNKIKMVIAAMNVHSMTNNRLICRGPKGLKIAQYGPYSGREMSQGALVTSFFEKKLIEEVGYFDSVRYGADSEFLERVEILHGRQMRAAPLDMLTYNVFRDRNGSLTTDSKTGLKSASRMLYKKSYRLWHQKIESLYAVIGSQVKDVICPHVNFPISSRRPFEVHDVESILLPNNNSTESFKEISKEPKISIVMQSFLEEYPGARSDPEKKFVRAVYSVIGQTNSNWELVIISDGCSITERLYNEHFKEYNNILFKKLDKPTFSGMDPEQQKNERTRYIIPGSPRGRGVEMSSGDWICYLDADDIFTKDAISKITKYITTLEKGPVEKRYLFNKVRIEHSSFDVKTPSLKTTFGERATVSIEGLSDYWKEVFVANEGGVIASTSQIIHKKGYPEHSWGDSGDPLLTKDTVFLRKIYGDRNNLKFCKSVDLAYYVRCHTRPGDVTKEGWDW